MGLVNGSSISLDVYGWPLRMGGGAITKETMVGHHCLWFCLRLASCSHRFESQARHLSFFQFVLLKLKWEKDENKKETGIVPLFNKKRQKEFKFGQHSIDLSCLTGCCRKTSFLKRSRKQIWSKFEVFVLTTCSIDVLKEATDKCLHY